MTLFNVLSLDFRAGFLKSLKPSALLTCSMQERALHRRGGLGVSRACASPWLQASTFPTQIDMVRKGFWHCCSIPTSTTPVPLVDSCSIRTAGWHEFTGVLDRGLRLSSPKPRPYPSPDAILSASTEGLETLYTYSQIPMNPYRYTPPSPHPEAQLQQAWAPRSPKSWDMQGKWLTRQGFVEGSWCRVDTQGLFKRG